MSLALPTEWVFSNYSEVIEKGSLIQGFLNSFAYALIATTLGVVLVQWLHLSCAVREQS